jgi:hypothetical protein
MKYCGRSIYINAEKLRVQTIENISHGKVRRWRILDFEVGTNFYGAPKTTVKGTQTPAAQLVFLLGHKK